LSRRGWKVPKSAPRVKDFRMLAFRCFRLASRRQAFSRGEGKVRKSSPRVKDFLASFFVASGVATRVLPEGVLARGGKRTKVGELESTLFFGSAALFSGCFFEG